MLEEVTTYSQGVNSVAKLLGLLFVNIIYYTAQKLLYFSLVRSA
jgi:hypothetical protein